MPEASRPATTAATTTAGDGASSSAPPGDPSVSGYLEIKAQAERATLLVKSSHTLAKIRLTRAHLEAALAQAKVTDGIDKAVLDRILATKLFDKTHIVAQAVPPKHGLDARLEELVQVEGELKPKELEDGRVDYRDLDNFHTVKAGTVLVRKHPATDGTPGSDVFGDQIPPKPGKDVPLRAGVNTRIADNGLEILASKGGYLYRQGGLICVGETYVCKGDVDFKTGNLIYHGTIIVQGSVKEGFMVESDGDVTIEGSVEGAHITSHEGSVAIRDGVFGHGRALIKAHQGIHVGFAQDTTLECGGELRVEKSLRGCKVTAGSLMAEAPGSQVLGGDCSVYGNAVVAHIGAPGMQTHLDVTDRELERRREELSASERQAEKLAASERAMQVKLKGMQSLADKAGRNLTPRMAEELKSALTRFLELQKAHKQTVERIDRMRGELMNLASHPFTITVKEKIAGPVRISLYGRRKELMPSDAGKKWAWEEDQGLLGIPL